MLAQLRTQAHVYAGATWKLEAKRAPAELCGTLVTSLDTLTVDQVAAVGDDVFAPDKLMFLAVEEEQGDFLLACRELDCRARSLSQVVRMRTLQRARVPRDCVSAVAAAFSPLVRVEQSRGRGAAARVRAGGLVRHDYCVSLIKTGDVMRPVVRRNDRRGEPKPNGIQEIGWTYLMVREQQDYLLQCDVLSAMRNPLEGRSSVSIEKFGLLVRPRGQNTTLCLLSKGNRALPLEGYEIFAKKPLPKDSEEPNTAVRLGLTDWRGMIDVPPDELPLRLVYVKNGSHLIARLPVIPGYLGQETVELPNDDKRLETEAFVKGMESTVMDLVARREILAARIRRRLKQGKIDQARKLLTEIKSFRTKDDLEMMLTNRQQTSVAAADEREQRRIDQLLSGVRILLGKYLDPDQLVALQREVDAAAKSPPAEATAQTPTGKEKAENPEKSSPSATAADSASAAAEETTE